MTMHFSFKEKTDLKLDQVGGKGLSLIVSNSKGFNVPAAVVLSTEFSNTWMERLKDSPEWKAFAQTKPEDMAAAVTAVQNKARTFTFSEDQQQTLTEIRRHLQTEGSTDKPYLSRTRIYANAAALDTKVKVNMFDPLQCMGVV